MTGPMPLLLKEITLDARNTIVAERKPKSSCGDCYGRGYDGVRTDVPGKRLFNVCRCVGAWKPVAR